MKKHNPRYMLAAGLLLFTFGAAMLLFLTLPVMHEMSASESESGNGMLVMFLPALLLKQLLVILSAGPMLCGIVLTVPAVLGLRDERRERRAEEQQADDALKELTQNGALTPEEYEKLTKHKS